MYPRSRLLFVTGVALIIAFAATTVAAVGLMEASRSASRLAALRAQVRTLQARVGADEQAAAGQRRYLHNVAARATGAQASVKQVSWAVQSLPTEAEVAHLRSGLAAYAACIPQLQRELAGLSFRWTVDPRKRTARQVRPFTTHPLSRACSTFLASRPATG